VFFYPYDCRRLEQQRTTEIYPNYFVGNAIVIYFMQDQLMMRS